MYPIRWSHTPATRSQTPSKQTRTHARQATGASRVAAAAFRGVEALEGRLFMTVTPDPGNTFAAAFNVGDPAGGQTFSDQVSDADTNDFYAFTMSAPGTFHGRLRAYDNNTEVSLFQNIGTAANPSFVLLESHVALPPTPSDDNFDSGNFNRQLNPGQYVVRVSEDGGTSDYLVRFTTDYAGDSLPTARNIGTLSHAVFRDEVGDAFNTTGGDNSYYDPFDWYKFNLPAKAHLTADIEFNGNFTQPTFNLHASLIRDANKNGVLDPGEVLGGANVAQPLYTDVPAGTYFVRVDPAGTPYPNYSLSLYADYAGNTTAAARYLGNLSNGPSTFLAEDYLSPRDLVSPDPVDIYSFDLSQPRQLIARYGGFGNGATHGAFSIYRDANNDGLLTTNELVAATPATPSESAQTVSDAPAGRYYVVVNAGTNGFDGTYSLFLDASADRGGNSLGAATDLGTVAGTHSLVNVSDVVSDADPVDDFKLTLPAPGTIAATLSLIGSGGDANLQLVQDKNHNGQIDPGESIPGTFNGSPTELFKNLAAGTYFVHVLHNPGNPPALYSLGIVGDVIGNTLGTAQSAGTITGKTVAFNDYIQQDYGFGSDTDDFFKFSLSKTGAFTAQTTGTPGEDLDLQLILDKNHNGVIDPGEVLATSSTKNSPFEKIGKSLAAGTYFVRVFGVNGDTNYHLTLKA